jgi:uncharacterized protein (DUF608 family)
MPTRTRNTSPSSFISGVPLGAIGAGSIELRDTGWFDQARLTNNWSWPFTDLLGSFFAVRTETTGAARGTKAARSTGRAPTALLLRLAQEGEYANAANVAAIDYTGTFPSCTLVYRDPRLPLGLTCTASSQLVPHDVDRSSDPVIRFAFTLRNTKRTSFTTHLVFGFDNLAGCGGYFDGEPFPVDQWVDKVQEDVSGEGWQGLRLGSKRTHEGFARNVDGHLVVAVETAGIDRVETCRFYRGRTGLCYTSPILDFWDAFAERGSLATRLTYAAKSRAAAAVSAAFTLQPGETREVVFLLAWHFPHHVTKDDVDHGHYYAVRHTSAEAVVTEAVRHGGTGVQASGEVRALLDESSLPQWLVRDLVNSAHPAVANTVLTRDSSFYVHEGTPDMGGAVGTMDQRLAAHAYHALFYPGLDRRELESFARLQLPDGRIAHMNGNSVYRLESTEVGYGVTDWPDLTCSFILQATRYLRFTGEADALPGFWQATRRGLSWMESADRDGDLIPEGASTFDYDGHPRGAFIYTAILYLAALKAGAWMAGQAKDEELASSYRARLEAARGSVMKRFWGGDHFHQIADNPASNSFAGSLAGDWASRLAGLGPVLDDAVVQAELAYLRRVHLRQGWAVPILEATPGGENATPFCFALQLIPYLGLEAIYAGQVSLGLGVLEGIARSVWEIQCNPWRRGLDIEPKSGHGYMLQNYMTAPAGWNLFYALSGGWLDLTAGTLGLSPRPLPGQKLLSIPLFFPHLWLWLDFNASTGKGRVTVRRVFGLTTAITRLNLNGVESPISLSLREGERIEFRQVPPLPEK